MTKQQLTELDMSQARVRNLLRAIDNYGKLVRQMLDVREFLPSQAKEIIRCLNSLEDDAKSTGSPDEPSEKQRLMEALYKRVGGWLQSDCDPQTWRVIGPLSVYFPQPESTGPSEVCEHGLPRSLDGKEHFMDGSGAEPCLPEKSSENQEKKNGM